MGLTVESWDKLKKILANNVDYQYLLNYKFEYLHKAMDPDVQPSQLWEFFNKDSEWSLLNYLADKNWFIYGDWHNIIVDDDNAEVIVDRLVEYFTAICRFEMIAKVASTRVFGNEYAPGVVTSKRLFDKAVFFDKDLVLCFKESAEDGKDTVPGIYLSLSNTFDRVKFGLIEVDWHAGNHYHKIDGITFEDRSIHNIKMKDIQACIDTWNKMY